MSILEVLAAIPCVNSLKRADTIIRELNAKGYAIAVYKKVPEPFPLAPEGHLGAVNEINVPAVKISDEEWRDRLRDEFWTTR